MGLCLSDTRGGVDDTAGRDCPRRRARGLGGGALVDHDAARAEAIDLTCTGDDRALTCEIDTVEVRRILDPEKSAQSIEDKVRKAKETLEDRNGGDLSDSARCTGGEADLAALEHFPIIRVHIQRR